MGMYASLTSYKGAPISEIYNSMSWSDALNIWARLVYGECIQRKIKYERGMVVKTRQNPPSG